MNDICCICLEDIHKDDINVLSCNHSYHNYCLMKMLKQGLDSCAICRQYIENPCSMYFLILLFNKPISSQEWYMLVFICCYMTFSISFIIYFFLFYDINPYRKQQITT